MMQPEEARFLKRKVRGGNIDVHPTEKALIVNYVVEATVLGEMGEPMIGERKECQKVIRVDMLNEMTDIISLSREIVQKSRLINPAKLPEIEQLLYYLQTRKNATGTKASGTIEAQPKDPTVDATDIEEVANINDIDEYLEMLYEDTEKVRGAALILQLSRNPDNLEEIFNNETLVGALARTLREEWKRSLDVATNIVYIFFCFSSFTQFHGVIAHFKIGALTMKIIEHETNKYEKAKAFLVKMKADIGAAGSGKSKKQEYSQAEAKVNELVRKQDQFLRVSFYLLLNLAEDSAVEKKMRNKDIGGLLVKAMERENHELLILVVSYLKKLSIFSENKDDMARLGVLEKVVKLVPVDHEDLLNITLRLLLNLSFDSTLRAKMVKLGMLPKLVSLLSNENHCLIVLCILYHISMDDKCKSMFTFTDCMPIVMKMLLKSTGERVEIELMALCVNLACNARNAEIMTEGTGLSLIMRRAFKRKDSYLMKLVRNISQHPLPEVKMKFVDYIADLAHSVVTCPDEEFVLECVGVLANLTIPELDYELLLKEYALVEWMRGKLTGHDPADDLLLEVIMLVGTVCNDDTCAKILADSNIIHLLIDLLNAKQEDDEIVCQIVYVFYQMIFHESTREVIVNRTQAPAYLIDLMHDKNNEVRKVCDNTLDIIAEFDAKWAEKIQMEKFKWHNSQWLEMVASGRGASDMGGEEDEDEYPGGGVYPGGLYDPDMEPYLADPALMQQPGMYYQDYDGMVLDNSLSSDFFDEPSFNDSALQHQFSMADNGMGESHGNVYEPYERPGSHFGGPGPDESYGYRPDQYVEHQDPNW